MGILWIHFSMIALLDSFAQTNYTCIYIPIPCLLKATHSMIGPEADLGFNYKVTG